VQGQHRYERLERDAEPVTGGHHYEDLRRTQQSLDPVQKAEAPNRHAPAQSRSYEPKFDDSREAYEARHAALSEIVKERVESGKINASEASRAMFSFEADGSLKYRNEVIARMWKHRDLQEIREIAAEVRGLEQAGLHRDHEMER
jgi:hypothetical protein